MNQWKFVNYGHDEYGCDIFDDKDNSVISGSTGLVTEDYARRIVACVNACAGIETELLEQHALGNIAAEHDVVLTERDCLAAQNAELLAALKFLLDEATRTRDVCLDDFGIGMINEIALSQARAVIDKAEGKQ